MIMMILTFRFLFWSRCRRSSFPSIKLLSRIYAVLQRPLRSTLKEFRDKGEPLLPSALLRSATLFLPI